MHPSMTEKKNPSKSTLLLLTSSSFNSYCWHGDSPIGLYFCIPSSWFLFYTLTFTPLALHTYMFLLHTNIFPFIFCFYTLAFTCNAHPCFLVSWKTNHFKTPTPSALSPHGPWCGVGPTCCLSSHPWIIYIRSPSLIHCGGEEDSIPISKTQNPLTFLSTSTPQADPITWPPPATFKITIKIGKRETRERSLVLLQKQFREKAT